MVAFSQMDVGKKKKDHVVIVNPAEPADQPSRRWVLCHLSPLHTFWTHITTILTYFSIFLVTYNSTVEMQTYHDEKRPCTVLVNEISVPCVKNHADSEYFFKPTILAATFLDFVFLCNILIKCRTTTTARDGALVLRPSPFRNRVIAVELFKDILIALPWDLLWFAGVGVNHLLHLGVWRIPRMCDPQIRAIRRRHGLALFATLAVPAGTLLTVLWFAVGVTNQENGWVQMMTFERLTTPYTNGNTTVYLESTPTPAEVFWGALQMTTGYLTFSGFTGYPSNNWKERVVSIFSMLVGFFCACKALGVGASWCVTSSSRAQRKGWSDFVSHYEWPKELRWRLLEYLEGTGFFDPPVEWQKEVPERLAEDLVGELCTRFVFCPATPLGRVYHHQATEEARATLRSAFRLLRQPQGTSLIKPGQALDGLYFVMRGRVDATVSGIYSGSLGAGRVFGHVPASADEGEVSLQSAASVCAETDCDVLHVTRADVAKFLRSLPDQGKEYLLNMRTEPLLATTSRSDRDEMLSQHKCTAEQTFESCPLFDRVWTLNTIPTKMDTIS